MGAAVGNIDVLFANAGTADMAPLGSITEESFDTTFDINVKGTVFTVQKALPRMKSGGSIVLMCSTTGVKGTPAFSIYSATKAAIRNLARSWAMDLKDAGIRVNVVSPGSTTTPGLLEIARRTGQAEALLAMFAAQTPMGRIADPAETAAVVLFLASDDSSYMTGGEVFVDGGLAQV